MPLSPESSRHSLAAVREELEVAREEAAQVLDCLCAERESRAQDALQLKDAVPLSKHKEALAAVSEQLAHTLQELQEEKLLRGQAEQQAATLEAKLQTTQDAVPKEEHEAMKVSNFQISASLEAKVLLNFLFLKKRTIIFKEEIRFFNMRCGNFLN